jgi:iron-sulfur cluster assembly accessory protein
MTTTGAIKIQFAVTERAAKRITSLTTDSHDAKFLRLSVNGGGCSGFQYEFKLENEEADDDLKINTLDATLLVDPVSFEFLHGSTLDFVDDLMGQSFRVENPNAKSSCGCGTSFSL